MASFSLVILFYVITFSNATRNIYIAFTIKKSSEKDKITILEELHKLQKNVKPTRIKHNSFNIN